MGKRLEDTPRYGHQVDVKSVPSLEAIMPDITNHAPTLIVIVEHIAPRAKLLPVSIAAYFVSTMRNVMT